MDFILYGYDIWKIEISTIYNIISIHWQYGSNYIVRFDECILMFKYYI